MGCDRTESFLLIVMEEIMLLMLSLRLKMIYICGFKNETIANIGAYAPEWELAFNLFIWTSKQVYIKYQHILMLKRFINTKFDVYRGAGRPEATYNRNTC